MSMEVTPKSSSLPLSEEILPYDQAYVKLPDDLKRDFEKWCEDVKFKSLEKWEDMIANIKTERQLEIGVFTEFLECIARYYKDALSADPNNTDPRSIYERTCREHKFHFRGKESSVSQSTVLHSILNLRDLKETIYQTMNSGGDGPDDIELAWDRFRGLTEEEQREILKEVGFYPLNGIFWVYFDAMDAEQGTQVDPLAGMSADECCNILGIPNVWSKYDYGEHMWRIHYSPSPAALRYIPTIADASAKGWNPYFQPEQEAPKDAKWGWTNPLGTPRGTLGMPEVIHKGWRSGSEVSAFRAVPEEVGQRWPKRS